MVVQNRSQVVSAYLNAAFELVLQDEGSVLGSRVEAAMSDEMEDVIFRASQLPLQGQQRGFREPLHADQSISLNIRKGLLQVRPFALHVELRPVGWAGDHH